MPNEVNYSSLKELENQIILAIQPDKGAGYFEEESEEGFSAQFSYPSAKTVNKHMSNIINLLLKRICLVKKILKMIHMNIGSGKNILSIEVGFITKIFSKKQK